MSGFTFEDIESLSVDLPEDIAKRKWHGDFKGADRLIGLWLKKDIPENLRKKLALEREILKRLPSEYPYTYREAVAKLQEPVPDLTEEEFRALQDQGKIDWIYVEGEEKFFERFVETLLKVDLPIMERAARARENKERADRACAENVKAVKAQGGAGDTGNRLPETLQNPAGRIGAETEQAPAGRIGAETEQASAGRIGAETVQAPAGRIGAETAQASAGRIGAETAQAPAESIRAETAQNPSEFFSGESERPTEERSLRENTQPPVSREKQALLDVIRQIREEGKAEYRFQIRASLRIKEESFQKGSVTVHIPVPAKSPQLRDIRILAVSSETYEAASADSSQRAVCFREDMQENHDFWVEYSYVNRVDYVEMKPEEVQPVNPAEYEEDLREQLPHIRFTPYMRELAGRLTEGLENPLEKARSIYDYITTHVEYAFVRNYFTIENLAEYAAVGGRGDCGIQALMFITLCRIAGVPARWQSGLYTTPYSAGCHDWAQVYIAPYGWRYVDCSFGGSARREGDEERRKFYFGNLDPFRMVANSRFQQEFDVKKSFLRADPYDNQRGEAEYEDKGLGFEDFIWKAEIQACDALTEDFQ